MEMSPEFSSEIDNLIETVGEWPEIETAPHRFNATEFDLAAHEIGHIYQGGTLGINFPKRMRTRLSPKIAPKSTTTSRNRDG